MSGEGWTVSGLLADLSEGGARLLLDGLVVGLSLVMLSWQVVLADTVRTGGDGLLAATIRTAYPVADVVCVTMALVVLVRARHGGGVPVPALVLLVLAVASQRLRPPAADGQPYRRGQQT